MVLKPYKRGAVIHVEETLARALDMYSTRTTADALANYVSEQAGLPRGHYDSPRAIVFLVELVLALTPPDDKRMSFRERPADAAKAATPWDFGEVLATLLELGWGGLTIPDAPYTVRQVGEQLRETLLDKAHDTAVKLLEHWKQQGHAYPL